MLPVGAYIDIVRELVLPDQWVHSVLEIHPDRLVANGFTTVFLDVDNTLMSYRQYKVGMQHFNWVLGLKSAGLNVYLISNNSRKARILRVSQQLSVNGIYFACKPLSYSIHTLVELEGIDLSSSVIIGDQIVTDIALGKWLRIHSILVEPVDKHSSTIKSIQHSIERAFLRWVNPRLKISK